VADFCAALWPEFTPPLTLRPEQATGVLIAALDLLSLHYGMARRDRVG
jgi:hypothetical protein